MSQQATQGGTGRSRISAEEMERSKVRATASWYRRRNSRFTLGTTLELEDETLGLADDLNMFDRYSDDDMKKFRHAKCMLCPLAERSP